MEKEWKSGEAIWHMKQAELNALDVAAMNKLNEIVDVARLRQRVAELEKERDRLSGLCDKWNFECDEMREDNKRLANVADALKQQRDELLAALVNIQQVACSGSPELGIATNAIASVKEKA